MDSITQITLGAAVGQLGFQRQLGRRALAWGAVAGFLPDLDVLVRFSSNPYGEMLYHRGFTHSLFFAPLVGPILGYLLWLYYGKESDKLRAWIYLMIAGLITHPLLDVFTTYGTQLLAPFSYHRFVISSISIIDPLYTVPLMLSILIGLIWPKKLTLSAVSSGLTMLWSVIYLFIGIQVHETALAYTSKALNAAGIEKPEKIFSHPTLLQMPLRRVNIHFKHEVWTAYVSVYAPEKLYFVKYKKADEKLAKEFANTKDMEIFAWFSNGDYFIYNEGKQSPFYKLTAYDARYGFFGDQGLWGLSVDVDDHGKMVSEVKKAGLNRSKIMTRFDRVNEIFDLAWKGVYHGDCASLPIPKS